MPVHPQKIKGALSRLTKALEDCSEAGLQLQQLPCQQLQKDDHVLYKGKLDKIVAMQPGQVGLVALESVGEIIQLPPNQPYLVVRTS